MAIRAYAWPSTLWPGSASAQGRGAVKADLLWAKAVGDPDALGDQIKVRWGRLNIGFRLVPQSSAGIRGWGL